MALLLTTDILIINFVKLINKQSIVQTMSAFNFIIGFLVLEGIIFNVFLVWMVIRTWKYYHNENPFQKLNRQMKW